MRVDDVLREFRGWRKGFDVYLVGGVVRDLLLYGGGHRLKDCDVVLIGGKEELRGFVNFLVGMGARLNRFSRFGTAELSYGDMNLDVALARKERYAYPGALPEVEFTDELYEDSLRRDFTVNALYHDGSRVIDFHNGVGDLRRRVLRPLASFVDDPTRGLRGVRYKHKLRFKYHDTFYRAVGDAAKYMVNVSYQRIINELRLVAVLRRDVVVGAIKDAIRFNLLDKLFEKEPRPPKEVYLGRPNDVRWVVLLSPFLKGDLPLRKEEKRALKVRGPLKLRTLLEVHAKLNRWSDVEILTYMTWYADRVEREMMKVYVRIRRRVRVKMYPLDMRLRSVKRAMESLGISGEIPRECLEEPPSPRERQRYRLRCEGKIMEMYFNGLHR